MHVNRLFEITYLLIEHGGMTAAELAKRFEVSTRTIYRDIDVLSGAGIPVYAIKGKGGGIRLLPQFVLSRSLLSREEQNHLLASLQGLCAIQVPDSQELLDKIAALFGPTDGSWLEVDFSPWGGTLCEKQRFDLLRRAVGEHLVVSFLYYNAQGERNVREVEPLKILFKSQSWYLYGFCHTRNDYRIFKLNRMEDLTLTGAGFSRATPARADVFDGPPPSLRRFTLRVRIAPSMAFRVYDEFPHDHVNRQPDGSFIVELDAADEEWLYGFLLSFGMWAEVLEPIAVRDQIQARIAGMSQLYSAEPGKCTFPKDHCARFAPKKTGTGSI